MQNTRAKLTAYSRHSLREALVLLLLFSPFSQSLGGESDELSVNFCTSQFQEIHKEKALEIVYVFGYKDARPAKYVGDRYEKNQLVRVLTQSCSGDQLLCGFQRDESDAFVFSRDLQNDRKVFIKVINSSMTESDDENRVHPMQTWLSFRARNELLWALSRADVVFYNGHSRAGGGPDFYPPHLLKDKHVNYSKYLKGRDGFNVIVESLKKAKKPTKLFGLFSCKATEHFVKDLNSTKKGTLLLAAPGLIYYKEALNESIEALEMILRGNCKGLSQIFTPR